ITQGSSNMPHPDDESKSVLALLHEYATGGGRVEALQLLHRLLFILRYHLPLRPRERADPPTPAAVLIDLLSDPKVLDRFASQIFRAGSTGGSVLGQSAPAVADLLLGCQLRIEQQIPMEKGQNDPFTRYPLMRRRLLEYLARHQCGRRAEEVIAYLWSDN